MTISHVDGGERRRNRFGSSAHTEPGSEDHSGSRTDLEEQNELSEADTEHNTVGLRDRVGCYTWLVMRTWIVKVTCGLIMEQDLVYNDHGHWWDC